MRKGEDILNRSLQLESKVRLGSNIGRVGDLRLRTFVSFISVRARYFFCRSVNIPLSTSANLADPVLKEENQLPKVSVEAHFGRPGSRLQFLLDSAGSDDDVVVDGCCNVAFSYGANMVRCLCQCSKDIFED